MECIGCHAVEYLVTSIEVFPIEVETAYRKAMAYYSAIDGMSIKCLFVFYIVMHRVGPNREMLLCRCSAVVFQFVTRQLGVPARC